MDFSNMQNSFTLGSLTGATMTNTNFTNVDMGTINLTGVDLSTANLSGVNWSMATCPDGAQSYQHGGDCSTHLTP